MPTVNIRSKPEQLQQVRQHFQGLISGQDPELDPESVKQELRALLAGRGDGIDLDTPFQWAIEGITEPEPFFAAVRRLLPADAILYFE